MLQVFTTRYGLPGASAAPYDALNLGHHVGDDPAAVARNRALVAEANGVAPDRVVWMDQVHGADVAVVDGPRATPVQGVDALVTTVSGLALGVLVADCVPVLLAGEQAVAVAHAGRRGLVAGVVPAVVERLRSVGAGRLRAIVGPSIGPCCYEVGADVADEVCAAVPQARAVTRAGTPGLDLRCGVGAQLLAAGVDSLEVVNRCTSCDGAYFSYRRDGVTGRQAGLIAR